MGGAGVGPRARPFPVERWLAATPGARVADVRVLPTVDQGRGLFATSSIEAGDTILQVPLDCCMGARDVQAEGGPFGDALRRLVAAAGPGGEVVAIVALLLKERGRGEESRWAPYIASLPWEPDSGVGPPPTGPALAWREEELRLLRGTTAFTEASQVRAEVATAACVLFTLFRRLRVPVVLPGSDRPQGALQMAGWALAGPEPPEPFARAVEAAFAVVLSRAFALPGLGETTLVPLLDMCNSAPCAEEAHPFSYDPREQVVRLAAARPVRAGAEVRDHYGHHANGMLLVYFGYHNYGQEDPRGWGVHLALAVGPEDPLGPWKEALLADRGIDPARVIAAPRAEGGDPQVAARLRAVLRLLEVQDGDDHDALRAAEDPWDLLEAPWAEPTGPAKNALSAELDTRALDRLRRTCGEQRAALVRARDAAPWDDCADDCHRECARMARSLIEGEIKTLELLEAERSAAAPATPWADTGVVPASP